MLSWLSYIAQDHLSVQGIVPPTVGWAILYQLTKRQSPADIPTGQPDLGNSSIETPFSDDLGGIKSLTMLTRTHWLLFKE